MTLAAAWRTQSRDHAILYTFQSTGHTAKLRPVSATLLLSEHVPDTLTPIVTALIEDADGVRLDEVVANSIKTAADLRAFFDLSERVAREMFVSPAIVDSPREGADEISPLELMDDERWEILLLVGKGARALESFRAQQGQAVDGVPDAEGTGASSE